MERERHRHLVHHLIAAVAPGNDPRRAPSEAESTPAVRPIRPAQAEDPHQFAQRLCRAEVEAVLEKFGMQISITRVEQMAAGQVRIDYNIGFVPRPGRPAGK